MPGPEGRRGASVGHAVGEPGVHVGADPCGPGPSATGEQLLVAFPPQGPACVFSGPDRVGAGEVGESAQGLPVPEQEGSAFGAGVAHDAGEHADGLGADRAGCLPGDRKSVV